MTATKKPSAPCSVCERRTYVRKDGAIGYHAGTQKDQAGFRKKCAGVGQPPAVVAGTESVRVTVSARVLGLLLSGDPDALRQAVAELGQRTVDAAKAVAARDDAKAAS